jgi:hypothetical protein
MSHFAKIDSNNIVTEIIVSEKDFINTGLVGDEFLWVQTSYNGTFRKQPASINGTYDKAKDVFIAPRPYPSSVLDENNDWQYPVEAPIGTYVWDEPTTSWVDATQ